MGELCIICEILDTGVVLVVSPLFIVVSLLFQFKINPKLTGLEGVLLEMI